MSPNGWTKFSDVMSESPKIVEHFLGYSPPFDVSRVMARYMGILEPVEILGLREVRITNHDAMPASTRRYTSKLERRRRSAGRHVGGLYYPRNGTEAASIYVLVDRVTNGVPRILLRIPPVRDLLFAPTFFHEIGHHVQAGQRGPQSEKTANRIKKELLARYMRRQYRYLSPFFLILARLRRSVAACRTYVRSGGR